MLRFAPTTAYAYRRNVIRNRSTLSSKVVESVQDALDAVPNWNGIDVAIGGFGLGGIPETLLDAVARREDAQNLRVISLTAGVDGFGIGKLLLDSKKVKRLVSSYVGENKLLEQQYFSGQLEIELTPQGTIAERLRSAGAGIPAFYTPTGAGTIYAKGGIPVKYSQTNLQEVEIYSQPRETRIFDDVEYVLEHSIKTHVSLVKAAVADTRGNLIFHGTSANANPDCAMAGRICLVEAEQIVQAGELDPNSIHLPGIYVHKVVHATMNEKRIERLKIRDNSNDDSSKLALVNAGRIRMMKRAAKEFKNGMYVNLGIGIPTMASNYIPDGIDIELQAENGLLGIGAYPKSLELASPDYINAGKETITFLNGASAFSSSQSFAMIRGSHVDLTMLGGLQCSASGDLANWIVPGKIVKGMGGAMDLVCAPGSKVVVTMDHVAKDGSPKILQQCTLPLTGSNVVDRIITDMCVFDIDKRGTSGLQLVEIANEYTVDDVIKATGCTFTVADNLCSMTD